MAPRREEHHSLCYAAKLGGTSQATLRLCIDMKFLRSSGTTWDGRDGYNPASVREALGKLHEWRREHRMIRENSTPAHWCDECERWKPVGAFARPGVCNECHKEKQPVRTMAEAEGKR